MTQIEQLIREVGRLHKMPPSPELPATLNDWGKDLARVAYNEAVDAALEVVFKYADDQRARRRAGNLGKHHR